MEGIENVRKYGRVKSQQIQRLKNEEWEFDSLKMKLCKVGKCTSIKVPRNKCGKMKIAETWRNQADQIRLIWKNIQENVQLWKIVKCVSVL